MESPKQSSYVPRSVHDHQHMRSFTEDMRSGCHSEQDLPVSGFIIALHLAFVGHQGTTEVVAEVLKAPMWQFLIQQSLPDIA